jgi:hydroxymethylglutaryl-CoA lyase
MLPSLRSPLCHACRVASRARRASPLVRRTAAAAAAAAYSTPSGASNRVKLVEVGPRDGLQNEKTPIPLDTKLELIRRLAQTGLRTIEAGAFVAPKWVPQMANSADILASILDTPPKAAPAEATGGDDAMSYAFLVPNAKGLEAMQATLKGRAYSTQQTPTPSRPAVEAAVFVAATEAFSQKNLNCSVAESLERLRPVIRDAKTAGLRVRAYLSVVLGCPFEGRDVDPHRVAELATELLEAGADEISLGDTTGMGTAPSTQALLRCIDAAGVRREDVAMHFHDTYAQALVNTAVALEHGIRTFDCSVAGLGGCPYSPGATGNVATEDMVYFMASLGMDTGVNLGAVADVGEWISGLLGRTGSVVGRAVAGGKQRAAAGEA